MYTLTAKLTYHVPNAISLKDKRQVTRSLIDRAKQKFNVAIAEVDTQDSHQILTIGIAIVSGDVTHLYQQRDSVLRFLETGSNAELMNITTDEYSL